MILRLPVIVACIAIVTSIASASPPADAKPSWEKVSKAFDAYFAKLPGHHPQALITQTSVEPLWNDLSRAGWKLSEGDRAAVMKRIPTDKEFFVRQLQTTKGRRFMRTVATKYPDIYDKLDMLSQTDGGGKPAVSGLIAAPDAELTVKYMFSKGGKSSWAELLPQRKKFNQPTGRIYTAEELKKQLQSQFEVLAQRN
jgi:hypothetical protein